MLESQNDSLVHMPIVLTADNLYLIFSSSVPLNPHTNKAAWHSSDQHQGADRRLQWQVTLSPEQTNHRPLKSELGHRDHCG